MPVVQVKLCPMCGQRERKLVTIDYRTEIKLDRRRVEVHVPDLPIEQCGSCREQFFGNSANQMIDESLRQGAGLLTATQMQEARKELGVETQQELAELIGVAPESLSRWMKGHVIQSRLADTMLRVFFAVPEARSFLCSLHRNGVDGQPVVVADRSASIRHNICWVESEGGAPKSHGVRPAKGTGLAA